MTSLKLIALFFSNSKIIVKLLLIVLECVLLSIDQQVSPIVYFHSLADPEINSYVLLDKDLVVGQPSYYT